MLHIVDVLTPERPAYNGKKCTITHVEQDSLPKLPTPPLFLLSVDGEPVATCTSAQRLAGFAFEHGALEVCHAYDESRLQSDSVRGKG